MSGEQRVQLSDHFPTDDEAWDEEAWRRGTAPEVYVVEWRGCEVEFVPSGVADGTWETACYNRKGKLLWSASTCIWNSETFGQAVIEARRVYRWGEEGPPAW